MGLFDKLKGRLSKEEETLPDLVLKNMKPGWLVDFDLKTWEVKAYNTYDWGGDISHEWQLISGDDVRYLELEVDDTEFWSFSYKIGFGLLGPKVLKAIKENGDPPEEIVYDGETFYMEEMAGGHFHKDGRGEGQELLRWSYENDPGTKYLGIEQWGENSFEASMGEQVEEYQFNNILPRE